MFGCWKINGIHLDGIGEVGGRAYEGKSAGVYGAGVSDDMINKEIFKLFYPCYLLCTHSELNTYYSWKIMIHAAVTKLFTFITVLIRIAM